MKIAIEGCCHGALDAVYAQIATLERAHGYTVDLLLVCGDFQAIRNARDLQCMAVPDKYRQLGGFAKYYTGQATAPVLTIVIGGNHEASNYFWELYHGGWLAPNIYFLGHAGCIQVNGIRIAGASGIFKAQDFRLGHHERLPYSPGAMRSIYHIREYNVMRLSLLTSPGIFLSHDWPQHIVHHGDLGGLLRRKPYFRDDVSKGALGSPPLMGLLHNLKPRWWFAAHLHCRFEATVVHDVPVQGAGPGGAGAEKTNPDEIDIDDDDGDGDDVRVHVATASADPETLPTRNEGESVPPPPLLPARNPEEITLDEEEDEVEAPPPPPPPPPPVSETRFLALDKCLPKRQFLEVIDVDPPPSFSSATGPPVLAFDPEWLAIVRAFNPYMSLTHGQAAYPDEAAARAAVRREREWVDAHVFAAKPEGVARIDDVQQFVVTAPGPGEEGTLGRVQPPYYPNPQTAAFCAMLQIENKVDLVASAGRGVGPHEAA
ncbi:lariat debranching enzyme, C-terminal domain-containing protein [Daedaleopsis nitida]|nr:lariat debranching enzyme, C-terminal domain-containing protein [Daedaleopsis nitida]